MRVEEKDRKQPLRIGVSTVLDYPGPTDYLSNFYPRLECSFHHFCSSLIASKCILRPSYGLLNNQTLCMNSGRIYSTGAGSAPSSLQGSPRAGKLLMFTWTATLTSPTTRAICHPSSTPQMRSGSNSARDGPTSGGYTTHHPEGDPPTLCVYLQSLLPPS